MDDDTGENPTTSGSTPKTGPRKEIIDEADLIKIKTSGLK